MQPCAVPWLGNFLASMDSLGILMQKCQGRFVINMAAKHGRTLRHFVVSDCYISLENIQWLSSKFLSLETLECSLVSPNVVCHSHLSSFCSY
jgi:hypothetical protein